MENKSYNLTDPQKSIWLTHKYYPENNINNICGILAINQPIDTSILKQAIKLFIKNNDIYHTQFIQEEDSIFQKVVDFKDFDIEFIFPKSEDEVQIIAKQLATTIFDIEKLPLFEFKIFQLPNKHGGFIVNVHHIISDSWSLGIMGNKVISYYSSILNNDYESINNDINFSYLDVINSELEYKKSDKFEKDKTYWKNMFTTIPEIASIPSLSNLHNNDVFDTKADRKSFYIQPTLLKEINTYCLNNKISLFNFFMGIYGLYISRVSNLNDFCIGTPILNRTNFKEKQTCGMFINSLPLRFNLNYEDSFRDFLVQISQNSFDLLRHQKYNYQSIIEYLRNRDSQVSSLYNIMLSYQITKIDDKQDEIPHSSDWVFNYNIHDDIDIHLFDLNADQKLKIAYDYKTSKYSSEDICAIHKRIETILKQVLLNDSILLKNIDVITPDEKNILLNKFNPPFSAYPNKTVFELFEEQVRKTPDNLALTFEDTSLTYSQLSKKVNELSHYLIQNGLQYNDTVGLLFDKSLEVVISILAILKCNAIYLPIDTEYPNDRIEYIIKDSNPKFILLDPLFANKLTNSEAKKIEITLANIEIFNDKFSDFSLPILKNPDDLSYIMYTSGSTGNPKGTMIREKSIIRLVKNTNYVNINPQDHIIQTGSIVFDACTFELWGAFLNGASVYLIKKTDLLNPQNLKEYLNKHNITIMFITTALFNQLADFEPTIFSTLKFLLTGGEAVSVKHMKKVRLANPSLNLIHCYGPTENTTFSTCYNVTNIDDNATTISIGSAISNSLCYVVSKFCDLLQPIKTPGELWVGGDGVGKGYLSNPTLTSSHFVKNPFNIGTVYKTGDLVEWLPDGNINFIGRIDNQVKIRGFRIELSEIDNKILNYDHIKQSITIVNTISEKKYICSYFVADEKINLETLKTFLKKDLPSYMIPNYIFQLPNLPMNINAKIDRKSLPMPDLNISNANIIYPRNNTEQELYQILSDLLSRKQISVTDDFINNLEMDSLTIMSFSTKLTKYNIGIQDISNYPSIEKLANKINNHLSVNYTNIIDQDITIVNKPVHYDLTKVLLTGSNGFLGCHLLKDLVLNENVQTVYCLIRNKAKVTPEERLKETAKYFFDEYTKELCYKKVVVLSGDFEKENLGLSDEQYTNLVSQVTTVIHCGANVKHYGNYNTFYNANVLGTINIIKLCKASHASLAHISTLSVGGYSNKNNPCVLDENSLYINQDFKNQVYMITKYEAECEVLKAINSNKISGKIFRLGNIMPRIKDGIFQKNKLDNAFMSKLNTISTVKCISKEYMNIMIDLSPVDLCSKAILLLLCTNSEQTIFHIFNNHIISIRELLNILKIPVEVLPSEECIEKIKKLNNPLHALLLNDLMDTDVVETYNKNDKTIQCLDSLGFNWNTIDKSYLNTIIKYIGDK